MVRGGARIQLHLPGFKSPHLITPSTTEGSEKLGTGTLYPQHIAGIQQMLNG